MVATDYQLSKLRPNNGESSNTSKPQSQQALGLTTDQHAKLLEILRQTNNSTSNPSNEALANVLVSALYGVTHW